MRATKGTDKRMSNENALGLAIAMLMVGFILGMLFAYLDVIGMIVSRR